MGFAVLAGIAALVIGAAACAIALPAAAVIGGGVLFVFSFLLWATPASALATLGMGLVLCAVGVLFVPPIIRGLVAAIRWPIEKIRDCLRKRGASK